MMINIYVGLFTESFWIPQKEGEAKGEAWKLSRKLRDE